MLGVLFYQDLNDSLTAASVVVEVYNHQKATLMKTKSENMLYWMSAKFKLVRCWHVNHECYGQRGCRPTAILSPKKTRL